ncbi:hypothetical protein DFJ74DRAFT_707472 [Hyaloraphidium curvatum]|nr:hypothetical protein DFJ74DRAFT_707472 [Hyaloraphidium curvatum]
MDDVDEAVFPELPRKDPLELVYDLRRKRSYVKVCAPMVRYSKLPFRSLVRDYGVDIAYTPMILAKEFLGAPIAREAEHATNGTDSPVIIQFAAKNAADLGDAVELAAPWVDGMDLNCGCPQRWAIHEGIGAHLMEHPELVSEMVREAKSRSVRRTCGTPLRVSIKIRVHPDLRKTVDLAQRAERAGCDWITVHGRTKRQKSTEPVNVDAIFLIKSSVFVPVFFNGSIFSLADADEMVSQTGVDGVMAARGLLANPALFAGYPVTPLAAVARFVRYSMTLGSNFFIAHHHLSYMAHAFLSPAERRNFNSLTSMAGVLDWLDDRFGPQWRDADLRERVGDL